MTTPDLDRTTLLKAIEELRAHGEPQAIAVLQALLAQAHAVPCERAVQIYDDDGCEYCGGCGFAVVAHAPRLIDVTDQVARYVRCPHGVAMDIHCCGCHQGFLFDIDACTCLNSTHDARENAQNAHAFMVKHGITRDDLKSLAASILKAESPASSEAPAEAFTAADLFNVCRSRSTGKIRFTVRLGDGAPFDVFLTDDEAGLLAARLVRERHTGKGEKE